jgi:predicted DNA-binding transcriptional regulator YafY
VFETSARLLRLLALLQARRFWTGQELAERLEVTQRTLRRDVEKLRLLGYPVDGSSGVAGGYQLGAGATLPPLLLEDDEALAVSLGLRTAAAAAVSGIEEAAVRALVKLERVLPHRLRGRANALRDAISQFERSGPHIDASTLVTLASACTDHEQALFRYRGRQQSNSSAAAHLPPSERCVEPAGLVHTGHRWYLVAWDTGRADWRTFRVDRIEGPVSAGQRFSPRPPPADGDLRRYVQRAVSTDVYEQRARVVVMASAATVLARLPRTVGVISPQGENTCVLETGGYSLDVLAYWIATLPFDYYVIEPETLVERLDVLQQRTARAVRRSRSGSSG